MKAFVATLAVALTAGPALAQIGSMNLLDTPEKKKTQEDIDRERAADDAYKSTLKSIPDQKKATNDPWADARGRSQPPSVLPKARAK